MRYFLPKSLTWWSGILAVLTGVAAGVLPEGETMSELAVLVSRLAGAGDASPATLIFVGMGLIGLRDKFERGLGG
ncbi:hypothetical protein [Tropicimonas isoalkanivorans]|uniref:Uncharacterized protein n=1 Tax=Tropicimonas isoalkanivorans TaxID=441112 RepID=A0A1I1J9T0_9RHOB|nr:hypothetical protein [Tropicimonas isoalkanivorans]SFC45337.1 hypothetical protein SAMN04488094_10534 [Tropicimonas isoalkanivorans]